MYESNTYQYNQVLNCSKIIRKPEQHLMAVVLVGATKYIRFLLFTKFDKIFTYEYDFDYIDSHTYIGNNK